MISDSDKQTIKYYDESAKKWMSDVNRKDLFVDEDRINLLKRLCETTNYGRILDIGVGSGSDAKFIIGQGCEYYGIDPSQKMLDIARESNPTGKFYKMGTFDLDFPDDFFDGFWALTVLLHIPKSRIAEDLNKLNKVIKSGGHGYISMKEGEGEKIEEEGGRYFSYYSESEFKEILEESGFKVEKTEKIDAGGRKLLRFSVRK